MKHDGEKQHMREFRAGLVDEIARTMQTLRQTPIAHPGETFYFDRLEAYQRALSEIDLQISDRGEEN